MLSLFRRNLFVNLVFLLIFTIVLQGYFFIESSEAVVHSNVHPAALSFLESFDPSVYILFSIILILIQAVLISRIIISNKLSRALSFIPGAVFILFASFVLQDSCFDIILIANLFFLLSISNLYQVYKKYKPIIYVFNAGFFLSLATLIYYPFILFLVVLFLGMISLRNTNLLEFFQLFFGFIAGLFIAGVAMYYFGNIDYMKEAFVKHLSIPEIDFGDVKIYVKPIAVVLLTMLLIVNQGVIKKKKNFDAIRKIEINYWLLLFGALSLFFIEDIHTRHLFLVSGPISILTGLLLERKENTLVKEFFFLLCVGFYFILVFDLI